MKKKSILILNILFALTSYSQITFQRTYGGTGEEYGYCARQTYDGGYVIVGSTTSFGFGNDDDTYLVKTDSLGNTLWAKTIGSASLDYGLHVEQTLDSGYIITGYNGAVASLYGTISVIKTNSTGNVVWKKCLGTSVSGVGNWVQQTSDGGYIVIGTINGNVSLALIKLSSNGDTLWTKVFNCNGCFQENANAVQQTSDGGYIVTGRLNTGNPDAYLLKTDTSGNIVWAKAYDAYYLENGAYCVRQTNDGGYVVAGYTRASFTVGDYRVYVVKTDSSGNTLWSKQYSPSVLTVDQPQSIEQTADGGYIISGTDGYNSGDINIYLLKTDSAGTYLWSRKFGGGGEDLEYSLQQTNDGGYIIAGWTYSFGFGGPDIYLIKTDSLGNSGCNSLSWPFGEVTPITNETNITYSVQSINLVGIPNTTSVNDGFQTNPCSITGNGEANRLEDTFFLFPNPATSQLAVSSRQEAVGEIEICDVLGKVQLTPNPLSRERGDKGGELLVDVSSLMPGIYFVKVKGEKEERVAKFVKQ